MVTCRGRWTLTRFGSEIMTDDTTRTARAYERAITCTAEVSGRTGQSSPTGLHWLESQERRLARGFAVVRRWGWMRATTRQKP